MKLSLTPEEFVELCRLLFPLKPVEKKIDPWMNGCTGFYGPLRVAKRTKKKPRKRLTGKRRK